MLQLGHSPSGNKRFSIVKDVSSFLSGEKAS